MAVVEEERAEFRAAEAEEARADCISAFFLRAIIRGSNGHKEILEYIQEIAKSEFSGVMDKWFIRLHRSTGERRDHEGMRVRAQVHVSSGQEQWIKGPPSPPH